MKRPQNFIFSGIEWHLRFQFVLDVLSRNCASWSLDDGWETSCDVAVGRDASGLGEHSRIIRPAGWVMGNKGSMKGERFLHAWKYKNLFEIFTSYFPLPIPIILYHFHIESDTFLSLLKTSKIKENSSKSKWASYTLSKRLYKRLE